MDQDQGRLYLGSREYLVALDMQNVNKEPLIVRRTSPPASLNLLPPREPKLCVENPDSLAGVRQEKRGMSDDGKRTTGGTGCLHPALSEAFALTDDTMTPMNSSPCRGSVPTSCG